MCDQHRHSHRRAWPTRWRDNAAVVAIISAAVAVFGLAGGEGRERVTVTCSAAHGGQLSSDGHAVVQVRIRRDQLRPTSSGVQILDAPGFGTFEAEYCVEAP